MLLQKVLLQEEEQFAKTLDKGLRLLEQDIAALKSSEIPGETIFTLYDTYGFPVDLTNDIARERGLTLDYDGYEKAMERQRERGVRRSGGRSRPADLERWPLQGDRHPERGQQSPAYRYCD